MDNLVVAILPTMILLTLIIPIFMSIWVYKDAKKRGLNAWLWVFVVIVLNQAFIGLIIYLLVGRSEQKQTCSLCGAKNKINSIYCNGCGTKIPEDEMIILNKQENKPRNMILAIIICIIIALSVTLIFSIFVFGQIKFKNETEKNVIIEEIKEVNNSGLSIGLIETNIGDEWKIRAMSTNATFERSYKVVDELSKLLIEYDQNSGEAMLYISNDDIEDVFDLTEFSNYNSENPFEIDLSKYKGENIDLKIKFDAKKVKFKAKFISNQNEIALLSHFDFTK